VFTWISHWPDGVVFVPRPAVAQVFRTGGQKIGMEKA